jgi:peptidoglycan/LPS O-acetylase OafA/YrhL
VLAYTYRNDVPTTPWLLLTSFAIAVATTNTWFAPVAYILLVAHIVLIVGIADVGALSRFTRNTDISFGTYIYAWPTQQTIASLVPEMSVPSMIAVALAIVLPIAFLSWVFVEKPILNLKQRYDAMSATERARMFRFSRERCTP